MTEFTESDEVGPLSLAVTRILNLRRADMGLSKVEAGRRAEMGQTMANKTFNSERSPKLEEVRSLSNVLGLDWMDVIADAESGAITPRDRLDRPAAYRPRRERPRTQEPKPPPGENPDKADPANEA